MVSQKTLRIVSQIFLATCLIIPLFGLVYLLSSSTDLDSTDMPGHGVTGKRKLTMDVTNPQHMGSWGEDGSAYRHAFEHVNSTDPMANPRLQVQRFVVSHLKPSTYLRKVIEVDDLEYGIREYYSKKRIPFIIKGHKIPEFKGLTGKTLLKSLHARIGETLYAATQANEDNFFEDIPMDEALEIFLNGRKIQIIDAVIPNLTAIPNILSEYNGYNGKERLLLDPSAKASVGKDVSVQMTSKGYFTFMHADPCDSGGGWVYGLQGVKNWIYLPTHYLDEQDERMTEGSIQELEDLSKEVMTEAGITTESYFDGAGGKVGRTGLYPKYSDRVGPMYMASLEEGDLVCWPPGWMHKVHTSERFLGLGSYIIIPGDREDLMDGLYDGIRFARGEAARVKKPGEAPDPTSSRLRTSKIASHASVVLH